MDDSANLKKRLRQKILLVRQSLSAEKKQQLDEKIFANICHYFAHSKWHADKVIAGYWPVCAEVDCHRILLWLTEQGWRVALPKIYAKDILFHQWQQQTKMQQNKLGVFEPEGTDILTPDIVITPLVVFDSNKQRLGYGGGFYDRYFQQHSKVLKIGVAYDCQEVTKLPSEVHDVQLDVIITESKIY
jgi:5-formyltetrahydrofolate cyclo-ligase